MLNVKDLSVTLQGKELLKSVSFSLAPARLTVLLGKNGSGKSTLLRALGQLLPYRGQVLLDGADVAAMPIRERAKRIGIFPQILPSLTYTVEELVLFGRTPHVPFLGRYSEEDKRAVHTAMEKCGITSFADLPLNTLSGGERQRAFLAMTLAQETNVLLLDEPVTYLDPEARRDFYTLLRQLAEEGKTVFTVLHDISEGLQIADDVLLLSGGKLLFAGTKENVLSTRLLEETFRIDRHVTLDGETFFS